MRSFLILPAALLLVHFSAAAQSPNTARQQQVFTYVEQMPEFPGGTDSMMHYIAAHIHYPAAALENNAVGRVLVKFEVLENGSINNPVVLRSVGYGCDEEAVRIVMSMPRWKPGKNEGKPVRVYFTLPFVFKL